MHYQTLLSEKKTIEDQYRKLQQELDALRTISHDKSVPVPFSPRSSKLLTTPTLNLSSSSNVVSSNEDNSGNGKDTDTTEEIKDILFSPLSLSSPSPPNASIMSAYTDALQQIKDLETTNDQQRQTITELQEKLQRYSLHLSSLPSLSSSSSSSVSVSIEEIQTRYQHELFVLKDRLHLLLDERNTLVETIESLQSLVQRMDNARFTYERRVLEQEETNHTLQQQLTELTSNYTVLLESNIQLIDENKLLLQRIGQLRTDTELNSIRSSSLSPPSSKTVITDQPIYTLSPSSEKKRVKKIKESSSSDILFELSPEPKHENQQKYIFQ